MKQGSKTAIAEAQRRAKAVKEKSSGVASKPAEESREIESAKEAMELCKRIWLEAMSAKDTFDFDDENIDALIKMAEASTIDPSKDYGKPEVILSFDDAPIFTSGDFSVIEGKAKSRKTFLSTLMTSLCLSEEQRKGTLFEASPNIGKVLWLDTEQGARRTKGLYDRLKRMMLSKEEKESLDSKVSFHTMRELGVVSRLKTTAFLIVYHRPKLIILDGIADLTNDVNSIPEANMINQFLMTFSSKYDCHIASVLHTNEGTVDQTARGHLGKSAMRKCANVLHCESDGEITKVSFPKPRDKKPAEFAIAIYEDGENKGLPYLTDVPEKSKNPDKFAEILKNIPPTGLSYTALCRLIKDKTGKSEPTAKRWVRDMGAVITEHDGLYYKTEDAPLPF